MTAAIEPGLAGGAAARETTGGALLWRRALWIVAGLTLLRWLVLALSPLELHGDEAQYWTWSQDLDFGYFTKPPLIAWLIAATTTLFGDAPFGVRFAAPLCHAIAALFIGLAGRALLAGGDGGGRDRASRIGGLAMLAYATMPAVSFSSLIMSTDAPLLAFWAVALWAFVRLLQTRAIGWALLCGLAVAVGLNAKYAMGYFLLCAALAGLLLRDARWLWRSVRWPVLAVVGLAGLIPNLVWNMANGWATVGHTAENANWQGPLLHLDKGLEFAASQFGVFGPILFAVLLVLFWQWARGRAGADLRLWLWFAAPVLALIAVQAFLSRANANWAATAYASASIAVMIWLAAPHRRRWLCASFGLHAVVAGGLYLFVVLANVMPWPSGRDPFGALRGWDEAGRAVADALAQDAAGGSGRLVLSDDRMLLASLLYATRGSDLRFAAWDADGVPGNHYELAIPYDKAARPPALLVSEYPDRVDITGNFSTVGEQITVNIRIGEGMERVLYLTMLN
ncbi:MAG: glycosyltransferase family 39 protein [Alphaproteobacteria bacterium]